MYDTYLKLLTLNASHSSLEREIWRSVTCIGYGESIMGAPVINSISSTMFFSWDDFTKTSEITLESSKITVRGQKSQLSVEEMWVQNPTCYLCHVEKPHALPGPRINIKIIFPGIGTPLITVRWLKHLVFIMGICIISKTHWLILSLI